MRVPRSRVRMILLSVAAACLLSAGAVAVAQQRQAGDVPTILNTVFGQSLSQVPIQHNPEPPLTATPSASCGAGSRPDPDPMQGRVSGQAISSGNAAPGYWCNLVQIGHFGSSGGYKTLRYVDSQGHECAFYDTTLLFPTNAIDLTGSSQGVVVLDMTDPASPVQTATLVTPAMLSPHESLNLNTQRGLLAADLGNPVGGEGWVDVYSVKNDCRHPVLQSSGLFAHYGHESGFSPDGRTFWATGAGGPAVTAIDLSDPKHPSPVWVGNLYEHGMTLSDDGNRAYVADLLNGALLILDTSQVQARVPNPQVREVSRLSWSHATIPQNAIPIRVHGHPYLVEFDEFASNFYGGPSGQVGAARIIDIADETHPRVVSNMRLAVNQDQNRAAIQNDPGMSNPVQGYAAHYCNVPREDDPDIVACSFISSGLRVFDIRDVLHPKEIAYFVSPPKAKFHNGFRASDFTLDKPAFVPDRREIWYSDGTSGFYVLRVDKRVWPIGLGSPSACTPAGGRLSGRTLGPVKLGARRAHVRRLFVRYDTRGRRNFDFYCLSGKHGARGAGIRVGYEGGKAIVALTHNRRYSLRGVRPGTRLSAVARRLHLGNGIKFGVNTWYVLSGRQANGLLKVNNGVVGEIGIADRRLTNSPAADRRFFNRFF